MFSTGHGFLCEIISLTGRYGTVKRKMNIEILVGETPDAFSGNIIFYKFVVICLKYRCAPFEEIYAKGYPIRHKLQGDIY